MTSSRLLSLPCLLLAWSSLGGQERVGPSYYPLDAGNVWHYRVDTAGALGKVAVKALEVEKVGGRNLIPLEASLDGKTVAREHFATTQRGIFRHQFNGKSIDPPFQLLRYPVKAGDRWDGNTRLGTSRMDYTAVTKEEEVEVPAGKFKTIRVDLDVVEGGNRTVITYWFAERVGMVKQTISIGGATVTLLLERFERARK